MEPSAAGTGWLIHSRRRFRPHWRMWWKWLETAHIPAMIIGGVAASALGRPRLTQDIDALAIVPEADWADVIESAARYGIVPRIGEALEFARRSRVLLLRHLRSGIDLDVTLGGLPFEQAAVEKSAVHSIGGLQLRLPRVEDLLVMKAIARRPKDIEDIRGLLAVHPQVDISEVRRLGKGVRDGDEHVGYVGGV
jgi:hypothetical protein